MPRISELHIYPIKSCAGLALPRAQLSDWGLAYDRNWMVCDAHGQFLTQREHPRLALVQVEFEADTLSIRAPGMPPLHTPVTVEALGQRSVQAATIWGVTMPALDTGTATAAWFSAYLGVAARLLRFDPDVTRLADPVWSGGVAVRTQFADGFPILVVSQAALDELNLRLQRKGAPAIPMNRFRPNIVFTDMGAHEEDYVDTFRLAAGSSEIILKPVKPCPRCPIPTIDQNLGTPDPAFPHEPLDTLAAYRADPRLDGALTFGQNAMIVAGHGAWLEIGQAVDMDLDFGS